MDQQQVEETLARHRHRRGRFVPSRLFIGLGALAFAFMIALTILLVNTRTVVNGVKGGVKDNRQATLINRSNGLENRTILCTVVRKLDAATFASLPQCKDLDLPTTSAPASHTQPPKPQQPSAPAISASMGGGMSVPD
jgi:hypothetical protein